MPSQSAHGRVPLYVPFQSSEFSAVWAVSTALLFASVVCAGAEACVVVSALFSFLLQATRRALTSATDNNVFFHDDLNLGK